MTGLIIALVVIAAFQSVWIVSLWRRNRRLAKPIARVLVVFSLLALAHPSLAGERNPPSKKAFWVLTAATAAVSMADVELTQHVQSEYSELREWNPLYGPHPSRARMYSIVAAENVGCAYLALWLRHGKHRRLRKLWFVPQAILLGAHGKGIVVNWRWDLRLGKKP